MEVSRKSKLKVLCLEEYSEYVPDKLLDLFYDKYTRDTLRNEVNIDENIYQSYEHKAKELIILKFVNKILANSGLAPITILIDFKKINKNDIVNDKNRLIIDEMETEIFGPFSKTKCKFNRKNGQFIINTLKGMLFDIGYELEKATKDKKNTDGSREWIINYTIIKPNSLECVK